MSKFTFSKDFVNSLQAVWQMIGSDIMSSYEEAGEEPENEACVEACIDADRMPSFDGMRGQAAQVEFRTRVAAVGYNVALLEAVRSFPFPLV